MTTQQQPDGRRPIKRALVSVYDKSGLEELVAGLHAAGVAIVSTGSTAGRIAAAGVPVTRVEELTGFPECLDGRVKTLHPRVHAGILADRRLASHREQLEQLGVEPFDLVVSNLYPFTETVASGAAPDECVEQIDIGGPAMVRAAAKNHAHVAVLVDPADYDGVLAELRECGEVGLATRRRLARDAFAHTAAYDAAIVAWFDRSAEAPEALPRTIHVALERAEILRYGENPHQQGARYRFAGGTSWWDTMTQHGGKALSQTGGHGDMRPAHQADDPCGRSGQTLK